LRIENEDLRGTIFEKKRKRKRNKFLNFYKKSEQEDQALIFSSTKIARARERVTALKEVELQQKRITADKSCSRLLHARRRLGRQQKRKPERKLNVQLLAKKLLARKLQKRPKKRLRKHKKRARQSCAKLKLKRSV
jgi:hypothetical protein